jgi:pentatricopeptide repeat protein
MSVRFEKKYLVVVALILGLTFISYAQKHTAKGDRYFDLNMFEEAIPFYQKQISEGGGKEISHEAYSKLADCYRVLGRFEEAEEVYKKLFKKEKKILIMY